MRTARAVPTPLLCRKTMISRMIFCSAQASVMRLARTRPMPVTSRRRSGCASIVSNTFSPKKLVRAFGEKVFDTIEAQPERLREVTGIGLVRAKRITDAWAEQKIIREIMVFLHSNGVGTARAVRIYKTYGADAVQVMTENPYRLARDIRGIGFKTADAIAMKLGVEKTAMIRVRAGISYALTEP